MDNEITDKEHILNSAGQRQINRVWELTQSFIAVIVTGSTLYVTSSLAIQKESGSLALLSNAFFLIIGFYFGRTNHARPVRTREH